MAAAPTPAAATPSTADEVPQEVIALAREIAQLPDEYQARLEPAFVRVVDSVRRRRRILTLVQDALAQLRLDVKYLMFDLDATRAERDELKTELGRD